MNDSTDSVRPTSAGWLKSPGFDSMFVVGIPVMAIVSGAIVVAKPGLFGAILLVDFWLLGYHHVISTYTRLCFDRQSFRENRFLILWLPILVLCAAIGLAHGMGVWTLTTIYLYWQWFHYTRQSWGISQVYRRKESKLVTEDDRLLKAVFYLLPLWGILYRSWQQPETFLFLDVWTVPVPRIVVDAVGVVAVTTLLYWSWGRFRMYLRGQLPLAHTLYMLSHFVVFAAGYLLVDDITFGWLIINVWHNAQYVLFVWWFNTKRFERGISDDARFLSFLSQQKNWPHYFATCCAPTVALYFGLESSRDWLAIVGLAPLVIVYQAINFHHYIVDSLIWKVRKPKMQKTMGLE